MGAQKVTPREAQGLIRPWSHLLFPGGPKPTTIRKRERRKNRLGNPLHARASAQRKAWARNATRIRKEDVKPPVSQIPPIRG